VDICPEAVEVMHRRGVADARLADAYDYHDGPFENLLLLQHGLGLAGSVDGLYRLLERLRPLLNEGGALLCDSLDVRRAQEPVHRTYVEGQLREGRYFGEIRTRIEYEDLVGEWFDWLHVDPTTLQEIAATTRYSCEIILTTSDGSYLACLQRS